MRILFNSTSLEKFRTGLLVIPVALAPDKTQEERRKKRKSSSDSPWEKYHFAVTKVIEQGDRMTDGFLRRQVADAQFLPLSLKRFEVANPRVKGGIKYFRLSGLAALELGKDSPLDHWRRLGGDAAHAAKRLKISEVAVYIPKIDSQSIPNIVAAITEGALLAHYEFTKFKSTSGGTQKTQKRGSPKKPPRMELTFYTDSALPKSVKLAVESSTHFAQAVCFARNLVNTPPSDLLPSEFVRQARTLAKSSRDATLKVFNKAGLTKLKAGALLGVSRGSASEPFLIHLAYRPKRKRPGRKIITLVGKGITFDSGGLSIKTGKGMEDMKCDMAGAACVLAVFRAVLSLPKSRELKHELHILIPTAENMVSSTSIKPGDVLRSLTGKTIEVLNTDAEGRLILADALGYAARIKSHYILDLATLTGACIVALGSDYAGMFANNEEFAAQLKRAFEEGGERVWPLPLAAEYRMEMESSIADLRNIGTGGPGAILGALFLQEFVPPRIPWVHLDIAGPAFVTKGNEYISRGGTGFGVLSLLRFLTSL